jgi:hypothetical protein
MKQRPILFSTEMVQAILAGHKTHTRRTKGLEKVNLNPNARMSPSNRGDNNWHFYYHDGGSRHPIIKCPYGKKGDVLWVRETFCYNDDDGYSSEFSYKSDHPTAKGWKPSIHMPKDASRIWLRIKDVKVERLQAISDSDARKEGIEIFWKKEMNAFEIIESKSITSWTRIPSDTFKSLWKSINGYKSWNDNPWIWVIEFERIEKPKNI